MSYQHKDQTNGCQFSGVVSHTTVVKTFYDGTVNQTNNYKEDDGDVEEGNIFHC